MKLRELFEAKEKNLIGMEIKHANHGHDEISELTPTRRWDGYFNCVHRDLTSLKGAPKTVTGDFYCSNNHLTSLEDAPELVYGNFDCTHNNLLTLEGSPKEVNGDFSCAYNKLTSLKGCPEHVGSIFDCTRNNLTSLKDIHKHLKKMSGDPAGVIIKATFNPIKSHVLGVLLIENLEEIWFDGERGDVDARDIVNKYLPNTRGHRAVAECQDELIEAGFDDFAQI